MVSKSIDFERVRLTRQFLIRIPFADMAGDGLVDKRVSKTYKYRHEPNIDDGENEALYRRSTIHYNEGAIGQRISLHYK